MMAISEMNTDRARASASRLEIDNHDRYVKPLVHHHAPANTAHRVRLGRRDFCPLPRLHQMATDTKHAFETQSHVLPSLFNLERCLGITRSLARGRAAVAVAEVFVAVAAGDTLLLSSSVILFSAAGAGPCS